MASTRFTALQLGTTSLLAVAAGIGLYVAGAAQITGGLTVGGNISGTTLHSLTGITVGDTDGAGCTRITALNGTVNAYTTSCP